MKRMRFVAAVSFLAPLLIAGLTWAWWPRPATVLTIPSDGFSHVRLQPQAECGGETQMLVDARLYGGPVALIRGNRFVRIWDAPTYERLHRVNNEGRLSFQLHHTSLSGRHGWVMLDEPNPPAGEDYSLFRMDTATGATECIVPVAGPRFIASILSEDGSTFVVAEGGDHACLTVKIYDLPSGKLRTTIPFPDRIGLLNPKLERAACLDWKLTADGRQLILAEGWNGLRRTTAEGIEIFDTHTGTLLRRIGLESRKRLFPPIPPYLRISDDFGAADLGLHHSHGERVLTFQVNRRMEQAKGEGWNRAVQNPGDHHVSLDTGLPAPAPLTYGSRRGTATVVEYVPDKVVLWQDDDQTMFLSRDDGTPIAELLKHPDANPHEDNIDTYSFQPGRTRLKWSHSEARDSDERSPLKRLMKFLGLRPSESTLHDTYVFDWTTHETSRIRRRLPSGGAMPYATSEFHGEQLLIAHKHSDATELTLELWDLPVRREPWVWSVPAGVLSSLLLCGLFFGRRRLRKGAS